MKPVLIYDGDCGFCKRWVARWRHLTADSVDYGPSQELAGQYPSIPPETYKTAVVFVEANGSHFTAARAVFTVLRHAPRYRWLLWYYENVPGVAPVSETVYRFVASHRNLFGFLTHIGWGLRYEPQTFYLARWLFLRNLGLVFAVAFFSLYLQIDGLIGSNGILPANAFLDSVEEQVGSRGYRLLPTIFWLNASDTMLHLACIFGIGVSLMLTAGVLAPVCLFIAWLLYLSLMNVGRDFLSFQWDALLLETAFLAIFFAPMRALPSPSKEKRPSLIVLALFWWLLFRLMFSSGYVKLGDETWRNLTALTYHYETQPLPTWTAWYAHQMPLWFQETSTVLMFFVELVVPFFIVFPRHIRHVACGLMVGFQVLILSTGNYCFFNWLTIALCLLLLDDQFLRSLTPTRLRERLRLDVTNSVRSRSDRIAGSFFAAVIVVLSGTVMLGRVAPSVQLPRSAYDLYETVAPFQVVSSYGLFANMTTTRPEIIVEGSNDAKEWKPYEFRWKPGDLAGRPRFVAPHQPRLDWQMWFAALGSARTTTWFDDFMARLLEGSPEVLKLLRSNPFPESPPKYIRARIYQYHFTNLAESRETGNWWRREELGTYFGPATLRSPK